MPFSTRQCKTDTSIHRFARCYNNISKNNIHTSRGNERVELSRHEKTAIIQAERCVSTFRMVEIQGGRISHNNPNPTESKFSGFAESDSKARATLRRHSVMRSQEKNGSKWEPQGCDTPRCRVALSFHYQAVSLEITLRRRHASALNSITADNIEKERDTHTERETRPRARTIRFRRNDVERGTQHYLAVVGKAMAEINFGLTYGAS